MKIIFMIKLIVCEIVFKFIFKLFEGVYYGFLLFKVYRC